METSASLWSALGIPPLLGDISEVSSTGLTTARAAFMDFAAALFGAKGSAGELSFDIQVTSLGACPLHHSGRSR